MQQHLGAQTWERRVGSGKSVCLWKELLEAGYLKTGQRVCNVIMVTFNVDGFKQNVIRKARVHQ